MKKFIIFSIFVIFVCSATIAQDLWIQYEPNSYINVDVKSTAINSALKQISYYSKETNLSKEINSQPIDTTVTLNIVDCSGILRTKEISKAYYYKNKFVSKIDMDRAVFWSFHSPDTPYYQALQSFCSSNFTDKKVVKNKV